MNRSASVARFTKEFGSLTNALAPGESIIVTSYGKVHGRYIREGAARKGKPVDVRARIAALDYSPETGQRLIDAILSEV